MENVFAQVMQNIKIIHVLVLMDTMQMDLNVFRQVVLLLNIKIAIIFALLVFQMT